MTTLLAIVALAATVNPPRRVLELSPRPRPAVGAVAGLGVLVLVVGCAAASGPLLDALDASGPTFRIAAGLVLGFRALLDLTMSPRPEPEGFDGWGQAVIPVGFPVLFRPELALLAVAAGTDVGVAGAGLGGLVALGLGVAAIVAWPGERLARPMAALVSVVAVAVAVSLVVDGVLDV